MSAEDFDLPATLETLLQEVCSEQHVPPRRLDEVRALVDSPQNTWPACCGSNCQPCVEDSKSVAREILARWQKR